MKSVPAFFLAILLSFALFINASAQTAETIWLTTVTTAYKTGETVLVTVNALSVTPIQGFTFQIRYDPACLEPVDAVNAIPGMNGLSLPQTIGLVDASFASTVPQTVNGVLAEVRFVTLGGCQTKLVLESAALAVRNAQGFAAALPGVKLGEKEIPLNIDRVLGESESLQALSGTPLPLDPTPSPSDPKFPNWAIALAVTGLVVLLGFGTYKVFQRRGPAAHASSTSVQTPVVEFKHGSHEGRSFTLNKLPCLIGRDPNNDICVTDPYVLDQHAKIYSSNNGYFLMDLGGETFVNGRAVRRSFTALKSGDVVRLGKSVLFVFGS
jgi:hypothetical protein